MGKLDSRKRNRKKDRHQHERREWRERRARERKWGWDTDRRRGFNMRTPSIWPSSNSEEELARTARQVLPGGLRGDPELPPSYDDWRSPCCRERLPLPRYTSSLTHAERLGTMRDVSIYRVAEGSPHASRCRVWKVVVRSWELMRILVYQVV